MRESVSDFELPPEATETKSALMDELAKAATTTLRKLREQGVEDGHSASAVVDALSYTLVGFSRELGGTLGWTLESACLNWFRYQESKKKLMTGSSAGYWGGP